MKPTLTFFSVVNTLGALQCILTALALFSIKSTNQKPNRIFGLFLLTTAFLILNFILIDTGYILQFPHLSVIFKPLIFLVGPLLYFYTKSITNTGFNFSKKSFWHFILFLTLFILLLPNLFVGSDELLQEVLAEQNNPESTIIDYILLGIVNIQVLTYLFLSHRMLTKTINSNDEKSKQHQPANIKWFRGLILAIILVSLLSAILDFIPIENADEYNKNIIPFFITIIVYSTAYMGIRQSELFTAIKLNVAKKYEKSTMTNEKAEEILQKLDHLMKIDKIYIDSMTSLPKLAKKLNISTHHLSQILNEKLNLTFFNFINQHRVEAAKKKLLDPESQNNTILDLAFSVGFNSLSAFNTAFKKHTGMAPTMYKKINSSKSN